MKQRLTLLLIALTISTSAVQARVVEYFENFYVTAIGGSNFHRNEELRLTSGSVLLFGSIPGTFTTNEDIRYNSGWHAGGTFGYLFDGFRCEIEVSHRHQKIRSIQAQQTLTIPATSSSQTIKERIVPGGHKEDTCIMVNGIGTMPLLNRVSLNLGIGLGVSLSKLEINEYPLVAPFLVTIPGPFVVAIPTGFPSVRQRDELLAWQAIGGFTYDTLKNIVLSVNYKFFGTGVRDEITRAYSGLVSGNVTKSVKTPYNHTIDGLITWVF